MLNPEILRSKLLSLHGKDYGGYQALKGEYEFPNFNLHIRQIPKDPYAPSHTGIYTITVNRNDPNIINFNLTSPIQNIAFCDFLSRRFFEASSHISKTHRGTGLSGAITINKPGQAILKRNCVLVYDEKIELRCFLGLPADGRQINSKIAEEMFFNELPKIVELSLFAKHLQPFELEKHINTAVDAHILRNKLDELGLISFVANHSILPRISGANDRSLREDSVIPFVSPKSLEVEIQLPHAGSISGFGIPKGVTLIVGGGYHGKSTLLNALEVGCYNHIPNDGRELCVSLNETVKIRAHSGRYISKTNISPFIKNLPFQKDTKHFSTENASGSTSQAASIIEALEMGAKVLLMDEDTCATNFMIRDSKMQQLVQKEDEPITTFIDKVKQLYQEKGVSTILVLGGIGDYFDVADHVIQMLNYKPLDVTNKAHEISKESLTKRVTEEGASFTISPRIPNAGSYSPLNYYGKKGIYAKEINRLAFGESVIDLTDMEQLIELSQTKAIGFAMEYARKYMDQKITLKEVVYKILKDIENQGLDVLSSQISGHFAEFRSFELAFAFNRLRGFDVEQV